MVVVAPPEAPFAIVNVPVVAPFTPKPTLLRAASELAVAPRATLVVPSVIELFCKLVFGRVGISPTTRIRKAGPPAAPPVGPAKIKFAFSLPYETVNVPDDVIGPPATLIYVGTLMLTLVTLPMAAETHDVFPKPSVCSIYRLFLYGRQCHGPCRRRQSARLNRRRRTTGCAIGHCQSASRRAIDAQSNA